MVVFSPRLRIKQRGVTLIETLLAAVLAALAASVFMAAFPPSSRIVAHARHEDAAADSCYQQFDYWRAQGYAALHSDSGPVTQSFTPPASLPGATGTLTVTRVDANLATTSTDQGRLRLDATVAWQGVNEDKGSVTLTTVIFQ